jgi:hypothetical protein
MPLLVALLVGACIIAGSLGKGRKAALSTILIVLAVLAIRFLFLSSPDGTKKPTNEPKRYSAEEEIQGLIHMIHHPEDFAPSLSPDNPNYTPAMRQEIANELREGAKEDLWEKYHKTADLSPSQTYLKFSGMSPFPAV